MEKIKAGGGVVWRQHGGKLQVLVIYRNGVWDLPKGKLEGEESLQECAVREVAEETGSRELPTAEEFLGTTVHHYKEGDVMIEKETHWWEMCFVNQDEYFEPQEEEGIKAVKWVDLTEAESIVGYDNLKAVLFRFRKSYS